MHPPPLNVLLLCTHNSARGSLRQNQRPHPIGLETLRDAAISTDGLRSKNRGAFAAPGMPLQQTAKALANT